MWGCPCSFRKLSGMVRCTVVRTVEHYQCGAVHVRYINSWEWSDIQSYVVEHYQCGAVRVHYVNSREWSDVRVGSTSDYCHLWCSLRLAPIITTSPVGCAFWGFDDSVPCLFFYLQSGCLYSCSSNETIPRR